MVAKGGEPPCRIASPRHRSSSGSSSSRASEREREELRPLQRQPFLRPHPRPSRSWFPRKLGDSGLLPKMRAASHRLSQVKVGSAINFVTYAIFSVAYSWLYYQQTWGTIPSLSSTEEFYVGSLGGNLSSELANSQEGSWGALIVLLCYLGATLGFGMHLWLESETRASTFWGGLAYSCNQLTILSMNVTMWPQNQIVIVPQSIWTLLCIYADFDANAVLRLVFGALVMPSILVYQWKYPGYVHPWTELPMVIIAFVLFILLVCPGRKSLLLFKASLPYLLIATFAAHIFAQLARMLVDASSTLDAGYSILKGGLFASMGFSACTLYYQEALRGGALEKEVHASMLALERKNRKLKMVLRALHFLRTPVVIVDCSGHLIWANDAFVDVVLGSSSWRDVWMGSSLPDVLDVKSEPYGPAVYSLRRAMAAPPSGEGNAAKRGGDSITNLQLKLTTGRGRDNEEVRTFQLEIDREPKHGYSMIVFRDMEAEVRLSVVSAESAALQVQSETNSRFMRAMAHEMRTPLQGIIGAASLLYEKSSCMGDWTKVRESMTMIMASSRCLLLLVNNNLDKSHCEKDSLFAEPPPEPISAVTAIESALLFVQPLAEVNEKELHFEMSAEIASSGVFVMGHEARARQVCINLIGNALKYAKKHVWIRARCASGKEASLEHLSSLTPDAFGGVESEGVEVADDDAVIIISVSDDGNGIPPEESGFLFQEWGQLKNARAEAQAGSGLGLNLSRLFVNRMGGRLWGANSSEGGAQFSFFLKSCMRPEEMSEKEMESPLASTCLVTRGSPEGPACVPSEAAACAAPAEPFTPASVCQTPAVIDSCDSILLVDDVIVSLKIIRRMLQRLGFQNIDLAQSGDEALAIIHQKPPSYYKLVLSDLNMPGSLNGYQLLAKVRDWSPESVLGIMSAAQPDTFEKGGNGIGVNVNYIAKPITLGELSRFIEQAAS